MQATNFLVRGKHSQLRPPEQFLEIGVERDKAFVELNHDRREPRVRNIVRRQASVNGIIKAGVE